jgi:signal transduction histidine kinase
MSEMRVQMAKEKSAFGVPDPVSEEQHEKLVLNRKEEDLVSTIKSICKTFSATEEGQKAKLSCRSLEKELMVKIDHEQLAVAMNILLGNSVRFSPGNCQITVNLGKGDNNHAVIQIADNGIGIRDEYKATAFEPIVGNEGIGLDKVKEIIVAHEGTIRLEDNPGGGTVIVMTLPMEPEIEIEEAVMMDEE